ncbi:MAG: hypothetical protein AAF974_04690 [Cyanobacteria bacterium P01_E01_bin.34]
MQTCSTVELGDNGIVMTSIGVRQSVRLVLSSSLGSIAAIAMGNPAIGTPTIDSLAIAELQSLSIIQPISQRQQKPALLAQANQQAQSEATPDESEPAARDEPEREIEFTSPTFSIGVEGEGTQGEGNQSAGIQAAPTQDGATQGELEAGTEREVTASDEVDDEALAAQHDWVEFSVKDSDEAIARYGCDDLYCINALREQRGLPPLQLVWDAQNSNATPQ